jgi:hypothetical protein
MKNRMKPSLLLRKLIWVPIILFCKIFILNYTLDVYYVKMGQIGFFCKFYDFMDNFIMSTCFVMVEEPTLN